FKRSQIRIGSTVINLWEIKNVLIQQLALLIEFTKNCYTLICSYTIGVICRKKIMGIVVRQDKFNILFKSLVKIKHLIFITISLRARDISGKNEDNNCK